MMPDDDLIARLNEAALDHDAGAARDYGKWLRQAAARLTAAAEERDALEANRSNGWAAANAEIAKRERAEASLTAAAEREQRLREALRSRVVRLVVANDEGYGAIVFYCDLCRTEGTVEAEQHAPGCLAAAPADRAPPELSDDSPSFDTLRDAPADRAEPAPSAGYIAPPYDKHGRPLPEAQPPDAAERAAIMVKVTPELRAAVDEWVREGKPMGPILSLIVMPPREPTPAMCVAGFLVSEAEHDPAGVWRAMYDVGTTP